MLSGCSFWKKSNTPCWPGRFPVTRDVQAGGVSGGMIDRSGARAPRSTRPPTKGMTPRSIYGSSTANVAPSTPIRSVGPISHLLQAALAVLAHECHSLPHADVALVDRALAELLEVLGEREAPVALLDQRPQHDDVERLEAQIREEIRLRGDLPVVLPVARELRQHLEHAVQHIRIHASHCCPFPLRSAATVARPTGSARG